MPGKCKVTYICNNSLVVMAHGAMKTSSLGFCRSIFWKNVPCDSGCFLKIPGHNTYESSYICSNNPSLAFLFSFFGLPEHIVTDNGSQFTSEEFKTFLSKNDILHTTTAPGHPATNGLARDMLDISKLP